MKVPALFAWTQAGSEEGFGERVFSLSSSVCPRASLSWEAALIGSSDPPCQQRHGREAGKQLSCGFEPSEAVLTATFCLTARWKLTRVHEQAS